MPYILRDKNNKIIAQSSLRQEDAGITEFIEEADLSDEIIEQNKPALTWDDIRNKRDALLSDTDWTQLADSPLTAEQRTAHETYRQALRDLPQDFNAPDGDPKDVIYPDKP